ncbi:MAG: hypothetical protein QXN93_07015 [Methanomassiliicoccales archaeon]
MRQSAWKTILRTSKDKGFDEISRCKYQKHGNTIEIDCLDCTGNKSLSDRKCLNSLCSILQTEECVERLVMIGDYDIMFEPTIVNLLKRLSRIHRLFLELKDSSEFTKRCKICDFHPLRILDLIFADLSFVKTNLNDVPSSMYRSQACRECLDKLRIVISRVETEIDTIQRIMIEELYRVVATDEEDFN